MKCKICDSEFNMETEGGVEGYIGLVPVSFCPTCLAGIFDMTDRKTFCDYVSCSFCGKRVSDFTKKDMKEER